MTNDGILFCKFFLGFSFFYHILFKLIWQNQYLIRKKKKKYFFISNCKVASALSFTFQNNLSFENSFWSTKSFWTWQMARINVTCRKHIGKRWQLLFIIQLKLLVFRKISRLSKYKTYQFLGCLQTCLVSHLYQSKFDCQ